MNAITIIAPAIAGFDPATLTWKITAASAAIPLTLLDSGPPDRTPGDGVYTAAFTPPAPSQYTILLTANGLSSSGAVFSRTAISTFNVIAPAATFISITDQPVTNADTGQISAVSINVAVNVQTSGLYQFGIALLASNQEIYRTSVSATLTSGTQILTATIPASALLLLGVGGPYEMSDASLTLLTDSSMLTDFKADVGPTQAYQFASLDPGPIYFTGTPTDSGQSTNGQGTFDQLNISVNIQTPGGACPWQGALTDLNGQMIDTAYADGTLTAGVSAILFSFSGPNIALRGENGPYQLRNVRVTCGSDEVDVPSLYQTASYGSLQFTYIAPSASLVANPAALSVAAGGTNSVQISVSGSVTFDALVNLAVSGLPSGIHFQFDTNRLMANLGYATLTLAADTGVSPGSYVANIEGSANGSTLSLSIPITVTTGAVTVALTPTSITFSAGQSQQFAATVANTSNQQVTWSISPNIGIITSTGAYTTPSVITASTASAVTVTAASALDASKTAQAIISLLPSQVITGSTGWVSEDVGQPGMAGATSFDGAVYTVQGSGSDVGDYWDRFQFAFTALTGDGSIIARLVSTTGTPVNSKAGIMIRSALDGSSSNAFLFLQGGMVVSLTSRAISGETTNQINNVNGQQVPEWLKLTREASTITGYTSVDGLTWTEIGSTTIQTRATIDVGLVVSSLDESNLAVATFDNVSVSPLASTFSLTPAESVIIAAGSSATANIVQTANSAFTENVTLSISGLPTGVTASFAPASLAGSGTGIVTFTIPPGTVSGPYPLTITGTSSSSSQSTILTLIVLSSQTETALPAGWDEQDVGMAGVAGQSTYGGGVFVVQGSGGGILRSYGPTPDQFQFAFMSLLGDGSIVARLVQNGTHTAGIMIRETLDPESTYIFISPSETETLKYRSSTAGISQSDGRADLDDQIPIWYKLVRQGTNFSAYYSWDGTKWLQTGQTISISMGVTAYAGLAVSSESPGTLAEAIFDSVSVTSSQQGFSISAAGTATESAGGTANATVAQYATAGFSDAVTLSASGLPSDVTASFSPTSFAGSGNRSIVFTVGDTVPPGTYSVTVTGTTPSLTSSATVSLVVLGAQPANWSSADIGAVGLPGHSGYSAGVFTVEGSGDGSTSDQFQYSFTAATGDVTIVARLASIEDASGEGIAGIMIRDSLDPNASEVWLSDEGGYISLDSRSATGGQGETNDYFAGGPQPPQWLKLVRQGDSFTGYTSPDGVSWTQFGPVISAAMGTAIYAGLAVTSSDNSRLISASFDNVAVSAAAAKFSLSTGTTSLRVAPGDTATVTITETAVDGFSDTVTLEISGLPFFCANASFSPSSLNGSASSTLTISTSSGSCGAGIYRLTILGTSASYTHGMGLTLIIPGPSGAGLPDGWFSQDIGDVGLSGQASHANGLYSVQGSGIDINGTSDQFQYVYTSFLGDGRVLARIADLQNVTDASKIGVMIRDTSNPNSDHVFLFVQGLTNINFTDRPASGSGTTLVGSTTAQIPEWLQILRQGNSFSAYMSSDGTNWTQVGNTITVQMNTYAEAGIVVSSGSDNSLATAQFDNVSVGNWTNALAVSSYNSSLKSSVGGTATATIEVNSNAGVSLPISLSATGLPAGVTAALSPAFLAGPGSSLLTFTIGSGVTPGIYPVNVIGSALGLSGSTTISLTIQAANNLPENWAFLDVGTVAVLGRSQFAGGSFTVQGSGDLVSEGYDDFQFAYTQLSGDGSIVARLSNVNSTSSDSQTGIMIRDSLNSESSVAFLFAQGGESPAFWSRANAQGDATGVGSVSGQPPEWLKLQGAGAGIWGPSDQFQYAYTALTGDGSVVARLLSTQGANNSGQAGIMIRNSLDPQSRNVSLLFTATGSGLLARSADGLSTAFIDGTSLSLPTWMKLVRQGDSFTAYFSADGSSWAQVATASVSMNSTVYAGLAASSQDDPNLMTATFHNVSVTPNWGREVVPSPVTGSRSRARFLLLFL